MSPEELTALRDPAVLAELDRLDAANTNPLMLAMQVRDRERWPLRALAEQLRCRSKAQSKLPTWRAAGCLFVPRALEQGSSEATARYKAGLLGGRMVDATAGLGVDAWAAATRGHQVVAWERDPVLASLLPYNAERLGVAAAITVRAGDAVPGLVSLRPGDADAILIDPDRRDGDGRRLSAPGAWQPDLPALWPGLIATGCTVLAKLGTALRPPAVRELLPSCRSVHCVSVDGEMKEVLALYGEGDRDQAVLLDRAGGQTIWTVNPNAAPCALADEAAAMLLDPDPTIGRVGASRSVAAALGLRALDQHGRLFTSESASPGAPGAWLRVISQGHWRGQAAREALRQAGVERANVLPRADDVDPQRLIRELRLRSGGDHALALWRNIDGGLRWALAIRVPVGAPALMP